MTDTQLPGVFGVPVPKWYVIGALAVVVAIVITRHVRHSRSRGGAERTA